MGCGCGKKGFVQTKKTIRPAGVRTTQASGVSALAAIAAPTEVKALGALPVSPPMETRRMDEQRQRLEKMRREAIKKRLNK